MMIGGQALVPSGVLGGGVLKADDYADFHFNTAVAALMELANAMQDYVAAGGA